MASAALKFIPITSAWASPLLEKMGRAVEVEINRLGQRSDDRSLDRHADLRNAFDLICEADTALANAGWAE